MRNFVLNSEIYLSIDGGKSRDIHNTFDFSIVNLDFQKMEAVFVLKPYRNEHSDVIELTFQNVNYFQFTENPFTQHCDAIHEVGYKRIDDHNMDWIMAESDYKQGDHFILRLTNGADLRIGAENMIASIRDGKQA